jgi:HEAT repeat protein
MTVISLALLLALGGRATHLPAPTPAAPGAPAASVPALTDVEVAQRVDAYLGTIGTPITADEWRALGPRAVAPLAAVATDGGALSTRRAKALGALSILGGGQARQVVLSMAQSEQAPFAVRASALRGAGQLLGPSALTKTISPVLQNAREAPVRALAAEVLASRAGASGCAIVRTQVAREQREVRAQFSRALERCGATTP